MSDATTGLLKAGHKRIAFVSGDLDHYEQTHKLLGYQDALAAYDIA